MPTHPPHFNLDIDSLRLKVMVVGGGNRQVERQCCQFTTLPKVFLVYLDHVNFIRLVTLMVNFPRF